MSKARIFCIALAVTFWPGLIWLVGSWHKASIDGPAEVGVGLLLGVILWVWSGVAAVAVFGGRD